MRALSFKARTQQMRSYAECIACIVTAPLFGLGLLLSLNSLGPAAVVPPSGGATWHAPPMMSPLHCDSVEVQNFAKN